MILFSIDASPAILVVYSIALFRTFKDKLVILYTFFVLLRLSNIPTV